MSERRTEEQGYDASHRGENLRMWAVRIFVLGSGSSGNALLVESNETKVLVEAGIGPRLLASRLAELGVVLSFGELDGIIATHHHGDHFGQADRLASAFGAPLYLHRGIEPPAPRTRRRRRDDDDDDLVISGRWDDATGIASSGPPSSSPESAPSSRRPPPEIRRYEIGCTLRIKDLTISTVQVPHDAVQVAVRVDDGRAALGIATDVGRVTPNLVALLAECDAALVEANHCAEMLAFSEYPDVVKRRVGGGLGHLSNTQTAELAARLVGSRVARLWLGHLSRSNNTPARALEEVGSKARRMDVRVMPADAPVALDVWSSRPHQLGLPFV